MTRPWEADPEADFTRRLGKSPIELGNTTDGPNCPDWWELSDGNFAVIGRDLTDTYNGRLPEGVNVGHDERIVVVPRNMVISGKKDIPDA